MPLSALISPVFFLLAGKYLEYEDNTKGITLLIIGILLLFTAIIECNLKKENK